jgi:hypothetical protein
MLQRQIEPISVSRTHVTRRNPGHQSERVFYSLEIIQISFSKFGTAYKDGNQTRSTSSDSIRLERGGRSLAKGQLIINISSLFFVTLIICGKRRKLLKCTEPFPPTDSLSIVASIKMRNADVITRLSDVNAPSAPGRMSAAAVSRPPVSSSVERSPDCRAALPSGCRTTSWPSGRDLPLNLATLCRRQC